MLRPLPRAFLALASLAACTGQVVPGGGAMTGTSTGAAGTGPTGLGGGGMPTVTGVAGAAPGPARDCTAPQAPAFDAALLSPSQYDHTILDLLKVGGAPGKDFGGGAGTHLDELGVERRANAAAAIAHQAALTMTAWSPCQVPTVAAAACEQQIIDRVGPRAFRRPLAPAERTALQGLFDAGLKEKDFATGVEWFLTGLLQAPDVLYQLARPAPGEATGQVVALGNYELASRLSYFLWDSMPDDALLAAAGASRLGDVAGLSAELGRLVADARFLRGASAFYAGWLKLDAFREVARDDKAFTSDVVASLETSLLASATHLYDGAAPNVAGLFSGESYYLDGTLRAFYGLPAGGAAFAPVELPGQGRRGILTHPGLMALLARPHETNPIARGLFVQRMVLCNEIPPPPAGVTIPPLAPVAAGLSTRDRLAAHTNVALCAACHELIDPPGYAFEGFDEVGRRRVMDGGKPVDTSGTMKKSGDLDGPFATGDDLLRGIAASTTVKTCFARQYFTHAVSRAVGNEDACSLDALGATFAATGDLKGLVTAIAQSPAFRYRASAGGAP